ncbi:hypothetical protein ACOMHN_006100 [Nucella lapillus]
MDFSTTLGILSSTSTSMPMAGDQTTFAFITNNNSSSSSNISSSSITTDDLLNDGNRSVLSANDSGYVFTTPGYAYAWVTLTNLLVMVTGVVGNALVIIVVSCVRDMRTPTNLCLMNLSLADLLVLLICQPSAMLEFYEQEKWMLGTFMCEYIWLFPRFCVSSPLGLGDTLS